MLSESACACTEKPFEPRFRMKPHPESCPDNGPKIPESYLLYAGDHEPPQTPYFGTPSETRVMVGTSAPGLLTQPPYQLPFFVSVVGDKSRYTVEFSLANTPSILEIALWRTHRTPRRSRFVPYF